MLKKQKKEAKLRQNEERMEKRKAAFGAIKLQMDEVKDEFNGISQVDNRRMAFEAVRQKIK